MAGLKFFRKPYLRPLINNYRLHDNISMFKLRLNSSVVNAIRRVLNVLWITFFGIKFLRLLKKQEINLNLQFDSRHSGGVTCFKQLKSRAKKLSDWNFQKFFNLSA